MARISTHVLDVAKGRPAAGMAVELRLDGAVVAASVTNEDGRTNSPLMTGESVPTGWYELTFRTGGSFYDDITIRFQVTEPQGNYHIPLLLSPYGYSTYRGS